MTVSYVSKLSFNSTDYTIKDKNALHSAGSVAFASLPTPSASNLGNVYNVTDAFTSNSNFIVGNKSYTAGTDVVVVENYTETYYAFYSSNYDEVIYTKSGPDAIYLGERVYTYDGSEMTGAGTINSLAVPPTVSTSIIYSWFDDNETFHYDDNEYDASQNVTITGTTPSYKYDTLGGENELPLQTSQSGKFLTTNGSVVSWANVPTEIPSQSGNSGKFLTTNGSAVSWATLPSEIEWATYGTTTLQEVQDWYNAGKLVLCSNGNIIFKLTTCQPTIAIFTTILDHEQKVVILHNNNSWSSNSTTFQTQIPAGTSGNIVTYSGTAGTVGSATINDIVPSQTSQSGKVLTTNGTAVSWTNFPTVDQTYDGTSTNAQSGVAVKSAIDTAISSVYKPAGYVSFASLPTPASTNLGNVYNVTDAFTTDSRFVEGAGKSYPAGTNVVIIDAGSSTYKFDVLAGFVDLSGYQLSSTAVTHTASTAVGNSTTPVYIASDGTATTIGYTIAKSVPSDAVFTDTTYSVMTGAGASTAGTSGLTPAPSAGDDNKYLKGDGTWSSLTWTYNSSTETLTIV